SPLPRAHPQPPSQAVSGDSVFPCSLDSRPCSGTTQKTSRTQSATITTDGVTIVKAEVRGCSNRVREGAAQPNRWPSTGRCCAQPALALNGTPGLIEVAFQPSGSCFITK